MFTVNIPMTPPYSFERLLRRLDSHPDPQMRVDPDQRILHRAYRLQTKPVLVTLQFSGDVDNPSIQLKTAAELNNREQQELLQMVKHMFSTDVDISSFYTFMRGHDQLKPLTESFRGLRFLLDPDLFQSMVRTIIGQQLNLAFASTLTERLLQLAGDTVKGDDGHSFMVFPTAEAIARLEVAQLRELQYSQRKAEYIIDFARAVVDEQVDLKKLWQMPDEEVINYLTPLRGIGRWTVECLLMFGMGRPDLLPAADIGLRNGIVLLYDLAEKPDEKEIRRIGESWAPWRSYVSLYMWEVVGAAKRGEAFR